MNTDSNNDISRDLDALRSHLRNIEKIAKSQDRCKTDAAAMEKRRAELAGTSYRDASAISELTVLERQIQLCNSESAASEGLMNKALDNLCEAVKPMERRTMALLRPIFDRKVSTIAAVMRPFMASDEQARAAALATDDCRTAQGIFVKLSGMSMTSRQNAVRTARFCCEIFEEALKKDSDLLQFLAPRVRAKEPSSAPAA